MESKIKTMMVFEILGRPAEHLTSVMNQLIDKIGSEKGIQINDRKIHEPKLVEQKDKEGNVIKAPVGKEMFSGFSEVQIETDHVLDLLRIVFTYMPSHVEVIKPSDFELKNFDLTAVANEIARKLHNYDAIAKNALLHNKMLQDKLEEVMNQSKNKKRKSKTKKKK
jgi:hypothetical protein